MKTTNKITGNTAANSTLKQVCLASCRKLLAGIEKTKQAILREFRGTLEGHERVLRLALTEAEALAWQSGVPELVFPTLAMEKAEAIAAWHARQRSIQTAA